MLERKQLEKVITWYYPSWFSDFVNKQAAKDLLPYYVDYNWLMWLVQNDFLKPSNELIAKTMINVIFSHEGNQHFYKPEVLLGYPQTFHLSA